MGQDININATEARKIGNTYETPSVAHRLLQNLRPADRPRRHDRTALSSERSDLALKLGQERSGVSVRAVDHLLGVEGAARGVQGMRAYV